MSFRSFVRELGGDWEVLAPRITLENEGYAYDTTMDLLQGETGLSGLYLAGGGALGVLQALRATRALGLATPVTVCHDLTPVTRLALQEGIVQAVLSHPLPEMARATIALMAEALQIQRDGSPDEAADKAVATSSQRLAQRWVALQVDTPESV